MWNLPYQLKVSGLTDIGHVRKKNEDNFLIIPKAYLYLLADGMGGHKAGEIASKETVRFIRYAFEEYLLKMQENKAADEIGHCVKQIVQKANEWVHHLGSSAPTYRGMGTTVCSALFFEDVIIHSHVGDSRIYCYREGSLSRLTQDHSLENKMRKEGTAYPKSPSNYRNILTRAVGTSPHVDIDLKIRQVLPGDFFLLCSDGLTDCLTDNRIQKILSLELSIEKKIVMLISSAKENGGHDNITAILIEVVANDAKNLFR